MITIQELRAEATRARDEYGNMDFYRILNSAADTIEELCKHNDGLITVAADALKRLRDRERAR